MVSQNRIVNLINKTNPEVFRLINGDIFGALESRLGSVHGAVNRILMQHEQMLKTLMPVIITTSPDDPNWYKRVSNYWHSFGLLVPVGGKELEIGFNYDLNDRTREKNIKELLALAEKNKITIDSDGAFMAYVNKTINEFDKYKYANPINVEQYLTWIFCLGHREVAKEPVLNSIDKSTKIRFVLIDPKEVEDNKRSQHTLSIEATKKYLEILADRSIVKNILYLKGHDASKLDDVDADYKLKTFADSNPKEFLALVNDKTSSTKARIERYCIHGILKRLTNSSIIVDANDTSTVIGNTIDEAVAFFNSESVDRIAKVKEFKVRYQQITNSN